MDGKDLFEQILQKHAQKEEASESDTEKKDNIINFDSIRKQELEDDLDSEASEESNEEELDIKAPQKTAAAEELHIEMPVIEEPEETPEEDSETPFDIDEEPENLEDKPKGNPDAVERDRKRGHLKAFFDRLADDVFDEEEDEDTEDIQSDNGEMEDLDMEDIEVLEKPHLRIRLHISKKFILGLIVAALFCGAGYAGYRYLNRCMTEYKTVSGMARNDNTSVNYEYINEGMLRYSKDGVSFTNKKGELIWNETYEMASPKLVTSGKFMAIGDIGSSEVRIFGESGQTGAIGLDMPAVDLSVASQGVVAVVLSDSSQNYINLYDKKGEPLVKIKSTIENTGYPLAISLSEDGMKLAVSYLRIVDGKVKTNLAFYNFGEYGKNEIDNYVGGFEYDSVFPQIRFTDNNTVSAFGNDRYVSFSMRNKPDVISELEFAREIRSVFFNEKYVGFVFKNADESSGNKYTMLLYTTEGKLKIEQDFDFDYVTIVCEDNEIVMYNDLECVMYRFNGSVKFEYTFEQPIQKVIPKGGDRFLIIDAENIRDIKIK